MRWPALAALVVAGIRTTLIASATAPEMTVLIGGMRALHTNVGQSPLGVLTHRPERLTTTFS